MIFELSSFTSYYVDNEAIINISEVQSMACWAHTLWSYNSNRSLETEYYISPHIKQYFNICLNNGQVVNYRVVSGGRKLKILSKVTVRKELGY